MPKHNDMELYGAYFTVFPNLSSYVFCYFGLVAMFGLIIFSLCRFLHKDKPIEGFNRSSVSCAKIIIIYIAFFAGYYIYCLSEYSNIYKNNKPEDLINIRADFFIENLLDITDITIKVL